MNFQFNSNYWSIYSFLILFILINIFKKNYNILNKLKNFSSVYVLNLHWVRTAAIAEHCCSGSHFFFDTYWRFHNHCLCFRIVFNKCVRLPAKNSESKWKNERIGRVCHRARGNNEPNKSRICEFCEIRKTAWRLRQKLRFGMYITSMCVRNARYLISINFNRIHHSVFSYSILFLF